MIIRKLLSIGCLFAIWMILKNYVFVESVTENVTAHPEWADVKHHSQELLKSATRVACDSLIDVLEAERRSEMSQISESANSPSADVQN